VVFKETYGHLWVPAALVLRTEGNWQELVHYQVKLVRATGVLVGTSTINVFFQTRFKYKGCLRKAPLVPLDKWKEENIAAFHKFVTTLERLPNHFKYHWIDEKHVVNSDAYDDAIQILYCFPRMANRTGPLIYGGEPGESWNFSHSPDTPGERSLVSGLSFFRRNIFSLFFMDGVLPNARVISACAMMCNASRTLRYHHIKIIPVVLTTQIDLLHIVWNLFTYQANSAMNTKQPPLPTINIDTGFAGHDDLIEESERSDGFSAMKANPAHVSHQRRSLALLAMESFRNNVSSRLSLLREGSSRVVSEESHVPAPRLSRYESTGYNFDSSEMVAPPLLRFQTSGTTGSVASLDPERVHRLCCEAAVLLGCDPVLPHPKDFSGSSLRPPSLTGGYIDGRDSIQDSLQGLDDGVLDRLCLEAADLLGFDISPDGAESEFEPEEDDAGQSSTMIEITPDISLPLHGSEETQDAILQGKVLFKTCSGCQVELTYVQQADWVVCSECFTFTEISSFHGEYDDPSGSVGLGIQAEMVHLILLANTVTGRSSSSMAAT
jgi:LSD1 subclass zinc finger protein